MPPCSMARRASFLRLCESGADNGIDERWCDLGTNGESWDLLRESLECRALDVPRIYVSEENGTGRDDAGRRIPAVDERCDLNGELALGFASRGILPV